MSGEQNEIPNETAQRACLYQAYHAFWFRTPRGDADSLFVKGRIVGVATAFRLSLTPRRDTIACVYFDSELWEQLDRVLYSCIRRCMELPVSETIERWGMRSVRRHGSQAYSDLVCSHPNLPGLLSPSCWSWHVLQYECSSFTKRAQQQGSDPSTWLGPRRPNLEVNMYPFYNSFSSRYCTGL